MKPLRGKQWGREDSSWDSDGCPVSASSMGDRKTRLAFDWLSVHFRCFAPAPLASFGQSLAEGEPFGRRSVSTVDWCGRLRLTGYCDLPACVGSGARVAVSLDDELSRLCACCWSTREAVQRRIVVSGTSRPPISPVLKHGPRSLTCARVVGGKPDGAMKVISLPVWRDHIIRVHSSRAHRRPVMARVAVAELERTR